MVGRTSGPRATSRSPFPPRLEGSGRASVKHLATLLLHGAGLLAGLPVACLTKRLAATLIPVQPVKGASAVAFGVLIMIANRPDCGLGAGPPDRPPVVLAAQNQSPPGRWRASPGRSRARS